MFKTLLKKCTEGHFLYNNKIYTQVDGVQMGSPLGPTLANWFLGYIEDKLFRNNKDFFPKFYTRYVDDVFAIFKQDEHVDKFLNLLNSQHQNLEFTVERSVGSLPFLDVEIRIKEDNNIETRIYRKQTNTEVLLNFNSVAPHS